MVKCSKCGFENKEGSNFCKKCGTKLEYKPGKELKLKPERVKHRRIIIKSRGVTAIVSALIVVAIIAGLSIYQQSLSHEPSIPETQEEAENLNETSQLPEEDENHYHAYYTGTIEHSGGSRGIGIIGYNAVAYDFPTRNATNATATNATIVADSTNNKDVDLYILDSDNNVIASSTNTKDEQPEEIILNETVLSDFSNLTAAVMYYNTGPQDYIEDAYYYLSIDVYYT